MKFVWEKKASLQTLCEIVRHPYMGEAAIGSHMQRQKHRRPVTASSAPSHHVKKAQYGLKKTPAEMSEKVRNFEMENV